MEVRLNVNVNMIPKVAVPNNGEIDVSIPHSDNYPETVTKAEIRIRMENTVSIMALLLLVDAMRAKFPDLDELSLLMPYAQYARKDSVLSSGGGLACKVFAPLINSCNFHKVTIYDAYSHVMPALLNNCQNISSLDVIINTPELNEKLTNKELVLVAPDFRNTAKVEAIAKHYGHDYIIQGDQHRDLKTGEVHSVSHYGTEQQVLFKDLLIVSDIAEFNKDFVRLGEKLCESGYKSIGLFATHWLGGRRLFTALKLNGFSSIYTTNSTKNTLYQPCGPVHISKII